MTRRVAVMMFVASFPKLLTWLKREAGFRKIRTALHAGVGTFPALDAQDEGSSSEGVEQVVRAWQQERRTR